MTEPRRIGPIVREEADRLRVTDLLLDPLELADAVRHRRNCEEAVAELATMRYDTRVRIGPSRCKAYLKALDAECDAVEEYRAEAGLP